MGADRYAGFETFRFERIESGVLRVTLSAAARRQFGDGRFHTELPLIWPLIDTDPHVRAVVVQGEGGSFFPRSPQGLELVQEIMEDSQTRFRVLREARELVYNQLACSKPIVAAVRGDAVGAGLAVALLADISVAARDAVLVDGHTRVGVAAGDHAAIIWPLLCGMAKTKYHLLTCEPLFGEEAERIGLVSLCLNDADVEDRALSVARGLASGPQQAISWTKHVLNSWIKAAGPIFETSLALEFLGFDGPDVREGVAAAREGREPQFSPAPSR
jgi:enoyl-CoA hydratase